MTLDTLFLICNTAVMPAWLLLALAPGWAWTDRLVHRLWIPVLLGLVYLGLFVMGPEGPEGASFSTLDGIVTLFSMPAFALVGWVHYLVFDLFIGAWEVRDARRRSIPHLLVVPCLALTLMLGPVGLLLYLVVRFGMTRTLTLDEAH